MIKFRQSNFFYKQTPFLIVVLQSALLAMLLSACSPTPLSASEYWPQEFAAQSLQVEYLQSLQDAHAPLLSLSQEDADWDELTTILAHAVAAKPKLPIPYSPSLNATHRLTLFDAQKQSLTLYYDQVQGILSVSKWKKYKDLDQVEYGFFQSEELVSKIIQLESAAVLPAPSKDEIVDASPLVLRSSITTQELTAEGQELDFNYCDFPTIALPDTPLYRVILPEQGSLAEQNQALVLISLGANPENMVVDIDRVDLTDQYLRIRVSISEPVLGEDNAPVSVNDAEQAHIAVALDSNTIAKDRIAVFVTDRNEILDAHRLTDIIPDILLAEP